MISRKLLIPIASAAFAAISAQASAADPQSHTMRMRHHVVTHGVVDHEHKMKGACMMSSSGLGTREYRAEMKDTSRPLSMSAIEAWNQKNNPNYGGQCAMPKG